VFHSLGKPELLRIVDLEVDKVLTRIKAKDVHIELTQSAKEFLIEKGYDPQYGARPMRRAVERFLEDPLAEELLRGTVKPGDKVEVMAVDGKLSFQVLESQPQSSAAAPTS
jgi:ATP-dependent Clp protease ATP-binding subunit ClpC